MATLSATRIPEVGGRATTRRRIEELALDPMAQYLIYCALMNVWSQNSVVVGGTVGVGVAVGVGKATTIASIIPW